MLYNSQLTLLEDFADGLLHKSVFVQAARANRYLVWMLFKVDVGILHLFIPRVVTLLLQSRHECAYLHSDPDNPTKKEAKESSPTVLH